MHRAGICGFVAALFAVGSPPVRGIELDWNVGGTADFFNPAHWNPPQVPTSVDDALIRNAGHSQALAGGPVEARRLTIGDAAGGGDGALNATVDIVVSNNLLVGAHASSQQTAPGFVSTDGQLDVDGAALLKVEAGASEHDFHIGLAALVGGTGVSANGRANIRSVATIDIGDDLKIGAATNTGGTANVSGIADWVRIGEFHVADDVDIALSNIRGERAPTMGETNTQGLFDDITHLDIGGDLGVGRYFYHSSAAAPFVIRHDSTASNQTFSDIAKFDVGGALEVGVPTVDFRPGAGHVTADLVASAVFERVNEMTVGASLHVGEIRGVADDTPPGFENVEGLFTAAFAHVANASLGGGVNVGVLDLDASTPALHLSARYAVDAQMTIEYSRITAGDTTSIGVLAGSANVHSADAFGELIMAGGTLRTPALRTGILENSAGAGSVLARGRLLQGSFIDTELLVEGEAASLAIHLGGLERSTLATFDGTLASLSGVYSAIDAADALLEGDIISDFDFTPASPGTYSFDLVVTDSLAALDDIDANLLIQDLPDGFCVIFYGVAEEADHDILRLTISTNCIPEPSSFLLAVCTIAGIAKILPRRVLRSLLQSNAPMSRSTSTSF
jgi:hypothetical protein